MKKLKTTIVIISITIFEKSNWSQCTLVFSTLGIFPLPPMSKQCHTLLSG